MVKFKKLLNKGKENLQDNPVNSALGISSLALGGTNLAVNIKRKKKENEFQKEQLEATERLTRAIEEMDKKSEEDRARTKKILKKNKNRFRKSQKPYVRSYDLPKGLENAKDRLIGNIANKEEKNKNFSIEEGGFDGEKFTTFRRAHLINTENRPGTIEVIESFPDLAKNSIFNSDTKDISDRSEELINIIKKYTNDYTINRNYNNIKIPISVYYSGNVLLIYLNKPDHKLISYLNTELDEYCRFFKNADYSSDKFKNNYVIEVYVVEGTVGILCKSLLNFKDNINILTETDIK